MSTDIAVSTADGSSFAVYLSKPQTLPAPGLIICSEAFGVNYHMRDVVDRFAKLGFIVAAPDLLWRLEPRIELAYNEAALKRASEIADVFDKRAGAEDVLRTCQTLVNIPGCNGKVGVVGFCIGGAVAYLAATTGTLDACVSYYGKGIEDYLDDSANLTCPTVLHYAGSDRFIPHSTVRRVRETSASRGNVRVFEYPGVDHGFNSEDRQAYAPTVAALAMERTMNTLREGLGGEGHEAASPGTRRS